MVRRSSGGLPREEPRAIELAWVMGDEVLGTAICAMKFLQSLSNKMVGPLTELILGRASAVVWRSGLAGHGGWSRVQVIREQ